MAIAGGSGSGKSCLAEKLRKALAPHAVRLCLDDFYRDRSHLGLARRARLNFDHPRAIDWVVVWKVLKQLSAGRAAQVPKYDLKTHCRVAKSKVLKPKRVVLFEGLWVLRYASIRQLVSLSIFLDCPADVRFRRRMMRDLATRSRTRTSIRLQFYNSVEPMHARFVLPQAELADVVLRRNCGRREIRALLQTVRELLARRTNG